jgi:hypothetical protein
MICVPFEASVAHKLVIGCRLMTLVMLFVSFAAASAFCANPTVLRTDRGRSCPSFTVIFASALQL